MTNFNESKLSKIIARRIVAPEDRSQLLPFSTPIYCPDNNGVKANRVTIFNPNANTFYTDASLPDDVNIGSNYQARTTKLNPMVNNVGEVTITDSGEAVGFGVGRYLQIDNSTTVQAIKEVNVTGIIPKGITEDVDIISIIGSNYQIMVEVTQNGNINVTIRDGNEESYETLGVAKFDSVFHLKTTIDDSEADYRKITLISSSLTADGSELNETIETSKTTITGYVFGTGSDDSYRMDLDESNYVTASGVSKLFNNNPKQITRTALSTSNTIDIDLEKVVRVNYSVPQEVELKADVNLMDMIKSDFAVQFKKAVSNEILAQIQQLVAADAVTTFDMGDNLPAALGKAIADNIANGTGQKFSIYKYDNGAPVEYMTTSAQPDIDDKILKEDTDGCECTPMYTSNYARIDDVQVPALYYCERPTLIFPETTFTEFTTGRVDGSIKEYADRHMNVDTAKVDFTAIGEGIFGTNDTFAVAFTQPSIKEAPDKNYFAKDICVEVWFGVKLIHDTNLKVFI